jgi:hypothetical protein
VISDVTLLPPSIRGDVSYLGLYRPSSIIAGDTCNVPLGNDGGIGFFQVDVEGHGATAAHCWSLGAICALPCLVSRCASSSV